MGKLKRKKGKLSGGTKPDLWKRQNYIPSKKLKSIEKREEYLKRSNLPEGKGTNRSEGSNNALKKMARW